MRNSAYRILAALLLTLPFLAKAAETDTTAPELLEQFAVELAGAAPAAKPNDVTAYAAASRKLADSALFERVSDETICWGLHTEGRPFDPGEQSVTEFDPRVWCTEYLAGFMFSGRHSIEKMAAFTVLAMDSTFRNEMDSGDYPYPFWQSPKKWQSYQLTKQVLFVFQKNRLIASYRSSDEDPSRPTVARKFDGNWHWSGKDHLVEPHVSLYSNLFSKDNPHVVGMETAYKNLESAVRQSTCVSCHSPDNASHMKKLILLNFPNQALGARHSLVKALESNAMPPEDKDKGSPAGIGDEATKAKFVTLAREFSDIGDKALDFEKNRVLNGKHKDSDHKLK